MLCESNEGAVTPALRAIPENSEGSAMQPPLDKLSEAITSGDTDLIAEISRVADHQLCFLKSPTKSK